jgi:hypothetical protein
MKVKSDEVVKTHFTPGNEQRDDDYSGVAI